MNSRTDIMKPHGAIIKVLGIGGGGGNAVNTMIKTGIEGVEFISANTDVQALGFSSASCKIQIGKELTKGLGAGADPDIGRDAALEDRHAISEVLEGANMVFVAAGMGGGTGTGGAPVIAQIAREMGALTVGVVTKPFLFEGKRRKKFCDQGIERLKEHVDTLITIPNQKLLQVASPDLSMIEAFNMADTVLVNAVKGISDIINVPGTINVDFADVKTVMSSMGLALMGIGIAEGENRATEAAKQAISSPLLEDVDIEGATGILINITAGPNLSLMEVNEACSIIQEAAHDESNLVFGAVIDHELTNEIRVTVIATGFPSEDEIGAALNLREDEAKNDSPLSTNQSISHDMRASSQSGSRSSPEHRSEPMNLTESSVSIQNGQLSSIDESVRASTQSDSLDHRTPQFPPISVQPEHIRQEAEILTKATLVRDNTPKFSDDTGLKESLLGAESHRKVVNPITSPSKSSHQQKDPQFNTSDPESSISFRTDDAIAITENLTDELAAEDQLDVPAFLRQGLKDLTT